MIGQIESYDSEAKIGVIKSDEALFEFNADDWAAEASPEPGDDVTFDAKGNAAVNVNLVGAYLAKPEAVKYRYVAAVLALVLGGIGAHRLYLGYYWIALAQLALTVLTVGFGVVWGFIEAVLLFGGQMDKDAKGRPLK
ncbi:TM2 domain-containing protein [Methylobacter sp. BlB1]|jgi:TM2 domain-containing membrane protein YozV|uniref:TM2 domain-containing protein n=1 Tax=Methylobacter sp. BlB1 TaxID=2785914 RepID=UPI0018951B2B|nr:TM2 domain-containing protein [Methylobacter sp. BlB1]MBF6648409.1 TM2 domain-containing protein [Methylobacter sp. BlB1]